MSEIRSDIEKLSTVFPILSADEIFKSPPYQDAVMKLRGGIGASPVYIEVITNH